MKYFLIAGEASGDLHGSNLMKELRAADPEAQFCFFGGDLMQDVGGELVKHYRDTAFMGILNVVLNLKTIRKSMQLCKHRLLEFQPDVLILIDYPGFNLRIAEFAHQNNINVFYYISPKIWAWKEYRVKKIRMFVDELFTILPFETDFYRKHDIQVNYIGNPLLDSINEFTKNAQPKPAFFMQNNLDERPVVAFLSGSRVQEIKNTLPVMVKAAKGNPEFQFVVAGVNSVDAVIYEKILSGTNIKLIFGQTYDLLNNSFAALVASGTAALETALFDVPQTILYRVEGGWLVDVLMRNFFLKIKWVSLPNLILHKGAIREFIQLDMTVRNVEKELNKLLYSENYREKIKVDYSRLKLLMGNPGSSKRAAQKMVNILQSKYSVK
ncbi:MAG TPA: lipid-A-disaccharide synthase [Prolixibacteraceae bacterium]|nr:lipid-A-disaccharide synthase [Prolixibacteraceae bacterium]